MGFLSAASSETGARCGFPDRSKLFQEPHITLKKKSDIRDPEFQHGDPLQTETEGKTGEFFGVITDVLEHLGIDHAGSQDLQPAALTADPATPTAAHDAPDIDLRTRCREGKETGAN